MGRGFGVEETRFLLKNKQKMSHDVMMTRNNGGADDGMGSWGWVMAGEGIVDSTGVVGKCQCKKCRLHIEIHIH